MDIIKLEGIDIDKDKQLIIDNSKEINIYYAYTGNNMLYKYIDDLSLSNKNLYKLKIFKELTSISVSLVKNGNKTDYTKLSELLADININEKCEVIVKGDLSGNEEDVNSTRTQLSDIMQQFIYLNIQLDRIQIMTEKEYRDSKKVKKFSENIKKHEENLDSSIQLLSKEEFDFGIDIVDKVKNNLNEIREYLKEAQDNEIKIAAAASKKSGKSVVVNSMLNCELAPTSLELATPNNCIYKKSDDGYTLEYNNIKEKFDDRKALREHIRKIFKEASMNKESGYAVSDMTIGYKPIKRGLSTYTIYDTPGPDLAGAYGHKKAAYRALEEADVIIFSIDYTKHFTNDEVDYLKEIKEKFTKNHKYYSLIFNVNKLDERYSNEDDKCCVRILDYLREKLNHIAPEFRDVIVIGTSALTYFDCIEIEKLSEAHKLEEDGKLKRNIEYLIEEWEDDEIKAEDINRLQFIENILGNMRTFEGIRASTFEQVKRSSGMLNLLSYIEYVANEKARMEKVNSLIFKIDNTYADIQNLFLFQKLEEQLTENQQKLEEARAILSEFSETIEKNFNKNYSEVSEKWEKDKKLFKSSSFQNENVSNRKVFKWDYLIDYCKKAFIEHYLNKDKIIEDILNETVKGIFVEKIDSLFRNSNLVRKINKKDVKVVLETDLKKEFREIPDIISGNIGIKIENSIKESREQLKGEIEKIKEDLVEIANERIAKFDNAVKEYSNRLQKKGIDDFDILSPNFTFDLAMSDNSINQNIFEENFKCEMKNKIISKLNEKIDYKKIIKDNMFHNVFDNILGMFKKDMYNAITYKKDAVIQFYDKEIREEIKKELSSNDSGIEEICQKIQSEFIEYLSNIIDYFKKEMENQISNAVSKEKEIEKLFDDTKELEERKKEIEGKRITLQKISNNIAVFCDAWKCLRQGN